MFGTFCRVLLVDFDATDEIRGCCEVEFGFVCGCRTGFGQ